MAITKKRLTAKELQQCIYTLYKSKNYRYFSLNTFGFGDFEADFVAIHPENQFCVEFEIKMSKSDFHADFKKKNKHELLKNGKWVSNQFFFVAEKGVLDLKQIPNHLGLIEVSKVTKWKVIKKKFVTKRKRTYVYNIAVTKNAQVLHQREFPDHLLIKVLTSVMHKFFENFNKGIETNVAKRKYTTQ